MKYHNITKDDMLNGEGLRVVLWLSGCELHCLGCQNPVTWDPEDGLVFDDSAKEEIFEQLRQNYIDGITFSGGNPLHPNNLDGVMELIREIREKFPEKTIWLYSGYTYEELKKSSQEIDKQRLQIVESVDVFCDGRFEQDKKDANLHWKGSSNQKVINMKTKCKII